MIKKETNYSFLSKEENRIWVRRLMPKDGPFLVSVFDHMTPESRYRRFHQTLDNVSTSRVRQEAENIAQADPQTNRGLLALANHPEEGLVPVGAVRIVELNPQEVELAISIRDDFQNQGIGTQLVKLIAYEARVLGYKRIVANIQNDNVAIINVFNKLPYDMQRLSQGSYSDIVITLN